MKRPWFRCIVTEDDISSGQVADGRSLRYEKIVERNLLETLRNNVSGVRNETPVAEEKEGM